jgi:phosphatidylserine decarboxylase precursor-related protein
MMDGASTPDPLQDADNRNILQVDEAPCLSFDHQRFTYVVQPIAGMLARRVVCRVQPGSVLEQGQRYGLIHFGSRMDLTLPPEAEVKAGVGDTLKGGETVLAILKEPHPL